MQLTTSKLSLLSISQVSLLVDEVVQFSCGLQIIKTPTNDITRREELQNTAITYRVLCMCQISLSQKYVIYFHVPRLDSYD